MGDDIARDRHASVRRSGSRRSRIRADRPSTSRRIPWRRRRRPGPWPRRVSGCCAWPSAERAADRAAASAEFLLLRLGASRPPAACSESRETPWRWLPDRTAGSRHAASGRCAAIPRSRRALRRARPPARQCARKLATAPVATLRMPADRCCKHAQRKLGDVVDQHMVAPLLALAEQHDALATVGQPAEAVRPVAVVRIARAVDQRRPQNRQRRITGGRRQHLLAGQMHRAMQRGRRRRRSFVQRQRAIGINRVGTDDRRHATPAARSARRRPHPS